MKSTLLTADWHRKEGKSSTEKSEGDQRCTLFCKRNVGCTAVLNSKDGLGQCKRVSGQSHALLCQRFIFIMYIYFYSLQT